MAKKVYISGKITNNSNFREEFLKADVYLKSLGYDVVNPVRIGECMG